VTVKITAPDDAKDGVTQRLTITAKSKDQTTKSTFYIRATVETSLIKFGDLVIDGDKSEGSTVTISLEVKNDGKVDAEDIRIKFTDKNEVIKEVTIKDLAAESSKDISFTYKLDAGTHSIKAETVDEWSGSKLDKESEFESTSELLPGNLLWIVIIVALVIVFVIGMIIASVSYSRGIPQDLKEEIAMSKQAARAGKSPEEIQEMRRKRLDRGSGERRRATGAGAGATFSSIDKEAPGAGEDDAEKPKGPSKTVRIKCPKCDKIQTVPSSKRPIEFGCSNCGMKLVLKK
jgi:ribosomal protein S27E